MHVGVDRDPAGYYLVLQIDIHSQLGILWVLVSLCEVFTLHRVCRMHTSCSLRDVRSRGSPGLVRFTIRASSGHISHEPSPIPLELKMWSFLRLAWFKMHLPEQPGTEHSSIHEHDCTNSNSDILQTQISGAPQATVRLNQAVLCKYV